MRADRTGGNRQYARAEIENARKFGWNYYVTGWFRNFGGIFRNAHLGQLGLHDYPMGILNTDGYYDSLLALVEKWCERVF